MVFHDNALLLAILGIFVGLIVGGTGVGGGALMTPLLIFFTPLPLVNIIATDLLFAATTKVAVSLRNLRMKSIDWKIVRSVWLGALPATLLASLILAVFFPSWLEGILVFGIGCLVVIAGWRFLRLRGKQSRPSSSTRLPLVGALLGGSISMTSIGAGAFGLALLRPHWPDTRHVSGLVATDIVQAIPISLLAGLVHLTAGTFDLSLFVAITPAGVFGAMIGSFLAGRLGSDHLKKILGVTLISAGLLTLSTVF